MTPLSPWRKNIIGEGMPRLQCLLRDLDDLSSDDSFNGSFSAELIGDDSTSTSAVRSDKAAPTATRVAAVSVGSCTLPPTYPSQPADASAAMGPANTLPGCTAASSGKADDEVSDQIEKRVHRGNVHNIAGADYMQQLPEELMFEILHLLSPRDW